MRECLSTKKIVELGIGMDRKKHDQSTLHKIAKNLFYFLMKKNIVNEDNIQL